ncbi:MAG: hypothetical protein WBE18_04030 [Gammaproteobacteria bacterium]
MFYVKVIFYTLFFILSCFGSMAYGERVQRLDVPPQTTNPLLRNLATQVPVIQKSQMVQQQQLSELIKNINNMNSFAVLGPLLTQYLSNPLIPRIDKLNYLWTQAQLYSTEPTRFSYLMDMLSEVRAAELIPEFVENFDRQTIISNKEKLLSAISRSMELPNRNDLQLKEVSSALDKSVLVQNSVVAQQFFLRELQQEENAELLRQAINFSSNVLPMNGQNYQLVAAAMQRLDSLPDAQWHLSSNQKNFLLAAMAFSTPEMQASALPDLLTQSRTGQEKVSFDRQLIILLQYVLPEHINPSIKAQLNDYLEKSGFMVSGNSNIFKIQAINDADQLYARAAVNSNNSKEQNDFIKNKILALNDSLEKARLLSKMHKKILQSFSESELTKLGQEFNDDFKHTSRPRERMIYAFAVDALNQALAAKKHPMN